MFELPLMQYENRSNRRKVVTTVYLTEEQAKKLKDLRINHKCNIAEFIRIAVDELILKWENQEK